LNEARAARRRASVWASTLLTIAASTAHKATTGGLAHRPRESVSACPEGVCDNAFDLIAAAPEEVLEEAGGFFGDREMQVIGYLCGLVCTLRRSRRYEEQRTGIPREDVNS
jgi:hypothetical protein